MISTIQHRFHRLRDWIVRANSRILLITLGVHVTVLLMIWGGLNALGAAVALSIPLLGTVGFIAYHSGKESAQPEIIENRRMTKISLSDIPFRG